MSRRYNRDHASHSPAVPSESQSRNSLKSGRLEEDYCRFTANGDNSNRTGCVPLTLRYSSILYDSEYNNNALEGLLAFAAQLAVFPASSLHELTEEIGLWASLACGMIA